MTDLGTLETLIMDALWNGGAGTVRQVADRLGDGRDRAYTTIMTTLDRLYRKALVRREKLGLAWRYEAAAERDVFERAVADAIAQQILRDHGDTALAAFVDAAVDAELLGRLEALIARRKRNP
jgi:predicted transcriptional regulator